MAIHILDQDRTLQWVIDNPDDPFIDGDTIELAGHNLIVDTVTCGSTDEEIAPSDANVGVKIANNTGNDCNLEFKDWSGIRLNASLPSNVHPYVDPDNPIPVKFADDFPNPPYPDDLYRTNLTANARVEIQLNGAIRLGGGIANIPTETRNGNFWAKTISWSSKTECKIDREINLHIGDILMQCGTNAANTKADYGIVKHYDKLTGNIQFNEGPIRYYHAGQCLGLVAGGIVLNGLKLSTPGGGDPEFINAPMNVGTLNIVTDRDHVHGTNSYLVANRVGMAPSGFAYQFEQASSICSFKGSILINQFIGYSIFHAHQTVVSTVETRTPRKQNAKINEICCTMIKPFSRMDDIFEVNGGYIQRLFLNEYYDGKTGLVIKLNNIDQPNNWTPAQKTSFYYHNCIKNNARIDYWQEAGGTISHIERSALETQTDLPDVWYHAPVTASDVTWKYEDIMVESGETIHWNARWMPTSTTSKASVAFTDETLWWPDLWKLNVKPYILIEFEPGLSTMEWHSKSIQWTNDTGEDKQIRIWECATGGTPAGYLRIWKSNGGPL